MKAKFKELAEKEVRSFLSSAPTNHATMSGVLKGEEKIIRGKFAEKFASVRLKGWLDDQDYTMGFFIESQVVDRAEFCRLMSGEWVPKDDRPNPMSHEGSSSVTKPQFAELALGQTSASKKQKGNIL